MKVKKLIELLKTLDENKRILMANDEEWNNLFTDIKVGQYNENYYVLFGTWSSEISLA